MHTSSTPFEELPPIDEVALLTTMVRAVSRQPEKVVVSATHGKNVTVLTVTVDSEDVSHVFGRDHRTIQSITHLVVKAAAMRGKRMIVNLDIEELS
jgi:predicted RNA-binding protein YlqC (UPF0109 family)